MKVAGPLTRYLASVFAATATLICATTATASAKTDPEPVLNCRIEGKDREVSISIVDTRALYRYGPPGQKAELTLSSPLADLDYRRKNGPSVTIDEIVTFANGDTAYRVEAGFRTGAGGDPTALQPYGLLTVSRAGTRLAQFRCQPDSITRVPDRLLAHMRDIGRERDSDGHTFPNYPIEYPAPARQSPPCEQTANVDTCWSRGVSAARGGDLRGAAEHYAMSCEAGFNMGGCYSAGKLYLHNRQLRDYARARTVFTRVCASDDPGQGPYACKYLGWMYWTGTGVSRDLDKAWGALSRACFLHNDALLIDPEGCHFYAKVIDELRVASPGRYRDTEFLSYIVLSQACTDDAATVCDEARTRYRTAAARNAPWLKRCEEAARRTNTFATCADIATEPADYDASKIARRRLRSMFLSALSDIRH
ncbi:tetratricopeptide repeat protein [Sphingomonas sp. ac-8]|uniref:tetratricopeptide repeat protein n=1 Tax=Sphingomonas sp. ac-8 TaxID=3242977 RepID=UPI003A80BC91